MIYLVTFRNRSTDLIEADDAAEARELAEASFGSKVARVEVHDSPDPDFDEDDGDDDEGEMELDEEDDDDSSEDTED